MTLTFHGTPRSQMGKFELSVLFNHARTPFFFLIFMRNSELYSIDGNYRSLDFEFNVQFDS